MTDPVKLEELSPSDFKKFLDSFDHVLSDCDGVIWMNTPLPGADKFYKKMEELGKCVHYVSNNSLKTKEQYVAQFEAAGIKNGYENLTIPSNAIAAYLKSINFNKKVYCVTCPQTMSVLEDHGFECLIGPDIVPDHYRSHLQYLEDDLDVGAVVFDSDYKVNLPRLYRALTYLKRPEVLFISGATDRHIPLKAGSVLLGTGVFTDLVIEESKRQPIQMGKPGKVFGEYAMKSAGITDPSKVLFIGDMIQQDVGLGKATGFKTLLLLTNNSKEVMLANSLRPDYYAESLATLVPLL